MAAQPIPNAAPNDVAQFSLEQEIADAQRHRPWQAGTFSKMLCKQGDLRLVLVCLDEGAKMDDHHADGSTVLQVLNGSIRCRAGRQSAELRTRDVMTLRPSIKHSVEALEPSVFLLTIAWPTSEKLESLDHRGYGS
jgi:quercetin dioxygenase-like cupin family protein